MLSAGHLENSVLIDQLITTADLGTCCASPDRGHRASVCSHQSLHTYRSESGAAIGTHNLVPASLAARSTACWLGQGWARRLLSRFTATKQDGRFCLHRHQYFLPRRKTSEEQYPSSHKNLQNRLQRARKLEMWGAQAKPSISTHLLRVSQFLGLLGENAFCPTMNNGGIS